MYEFLETFAQILCASLSLVVLSRIYSKSTKLKILNALPLKFVFFFCLFKVVFYYLLPSLLGYSIGHKFILEEGHTLSQLTQIYVIELVSWGTWGFGFLIALASIKSKPLIIFKISNISSFNDHYAKAICIIISMLSIPYRLISYTGLPLPGYFEPFKSLMNYGGGTCSILLLILGIIRWGRVCSWLGFLGTLSLLTIVGGRSAWLYCICYSIFLIASLANNPKIRRNIITFLITVPIAFFVLSGGLPSLVYAPDLDGTFTFSADTSSAKRVNRSTYEEFVWRFGASSRLSIPFIIMHDRGDSAGIKPTYHSFMSFIPRFLSPNKAHPSTLDPDDPFSQGMYLIYKETFGYHTGAMVEPSSGAHAYWEFGWPGVIILPFLTGIYIANFAYYSQFFGIACLPLLMIAFKPFGYVDPKIWFSDVIVQIYQICIPLIVIAFIFVYFSKFRVRPAS